MSQRPWHASYGNSPIEIDADAYPSVVAMMEAAVVAIADRPAFKCFGQTPSYADVVGCRATSLPICSRIWACARATASH